MPTLNKTLQDFADQVLHAARPSNRVTEEEIRRLITSYNQRILNELFEWNEHERLSGYFGVSGKLKMTYQSEEKK